MLHYSIDFEFDDEWVSLVTPWWYSLAKLIGQALPGLKDGPHSSRTKSLGSKEIDEASQSCGGLPAEPVNDHTIRFQLSKASLN